MDQEPTTLDGLEVYANDSGLEVHIKTGAMFILGNYMENTAEKDLSIDSNGSGNDRIDVIVGHLDITGDDMDFDVVKGTPAGSPTAPAITQDTGDWHVKLAEVYVADSDASLAAGTVTDYREFVMGANWAVYDREGGMELIYSDNSSTYSTIDLTDGNVFDITLNGAWSPTFPASTTWMRPGRDSTFTIIATQDGTGGRVITWPASVDWPAGTAPSPTTTANFVAKYVFESVDDGTIWQGNFAGDNYS
jgi:hypothetical protein